MQNFIEISLENLPVGGDVKGVQTDRHKQEYKGPLFNLTDLEQ